jgi:hypothetical protein
LRAAVLTGMGGLGVVREKVLEELEQALTPRGTRRSGR